jgi:hypothetical protein
LSVEKQSSLRAGQSDLATGTPLTRAAKLNDRRTSMSDAPSVDERPALCAALRELAAPAEEIVVYGMQTGSVKQAMRQEMTWSVLRGHDAGQLRVDGPGATTGRAA